MKKILFLASCAIALFITSCTNDDIVIDVDNSINEVNVNVSLTNLFSSYNFNDTYHNLDKSIAEEYRTFNSEYGKLIHVRTLFYDNNGNLVDSLVAYSSTTNSVQNSLKLSEGKYIVVTTLNFADKANYKSSWWNLCDKEKLSTAYLTPYSRHTKWAIMSYDAKTITVEKGKTTNVSMSPSPIGALGYMYMQNFQYKNQASYGKEAEDNGVRALTLYSQIIAEGYKLDPNANDKYIYMGATEAGYWYFLSDRLVPEDFGFENGYFESNLYDYFYILAPSFNVQFGYVPDGSNTFQGYGEANYTIENGQTYLAYWDWFKVGNPYFGKADNNHWNTYSNDVKSSRAIGANADCVKRKMDIRK